MQIKKPTATDSKAIRTILKKAGIKISVRKMNYMISIGRQCERLSKEASLTIINIVKSRGYIIDQEDIIMQLVDKEICDVVCVYVPAN